MSHMSTIAADVDELSAILPAADLHQIAEKIASHIGCIVIPDPVAAGDPDAQRLLGPVRRVTAKAAHYRAIAEGCRKKILQGRPGVSIQDAQNADRFAEDLEAVLAGLESAENRRFAAMLYANVMEELAKSVTDENTALKRLRDDLHVTTNRYLDRARAAEQTATFQARVQPWMMACFGEEISADRLERSDRFIEEALELVQAGDYPAERAHALIEYVYGRPQGDINQEVGGVMVTLAAHCLAHGVDMHAAGETELARIWTKVEQIRAKQAAKPKGSALPIAMSSAARLTTGESHRLWPSDEMRDRLAEEMAAEGDPC